MLGLSAVQSPSVIQACSAIQACNGITQIPPTSTPIAQTYAVDLDGVDDYITIPDSADLSFGNGSSDSAFSMSFWVKPNAFPFYVASKANSTSDREFLLLMNSTTVMEYYLYDVDNNNRIYAQSTGAYATDRWYHIVVTYDGSSNSSGLEIYVDGTLTTTAQGSNGTYVAMHDTAASIDLGAITWARYDAGRFKEAAIFNYELTSGNVTTLYGGGNMGDTASLDPVGHWRMGDNDGGTGTTITDQGSGGNDATLVNGPTFVEDVPVPVFNKYSVDFDGVDDYAAIADANDLSFGNGSTDSAFSISAWVKMDDATKFRIFSKQTNSANIEYIFCVDGLDRLAVNLYDGAASNYRGVYSSSIQSYEGSWIHVVMTYDGTGGSTAYNGMKLYLNGIVLSTGNNQGGVYTAMHNTTTDVWIGGANFVPDYANGKIDELAVFSAELTSTQVSNIYNSGTPTDLSSESNLVGYWRMEENTGTTVADSSGNGHTATLTNGPTFSTDVPIAFTNTYSVDFDGVDDYATIPDTVSNRVTGDMSISCWFKLDTTGVFQGLVNKRDVGGTNWQFMVRDTNVLYIYDGSTVINSTFTLSSGQWYHGVVTIESGVETKFYVNGILRDTLGAVTITADDAAIEIGRLYSGSYINGKIDEAAIFTSVLSAAQVTAIYNSGAPADLKSYSPVLWTRFEEGTGTSITDSSGNGHTATLTNGPTFSTDVPT